MPLPTSIDLRIVTPERPLVEAQVDEVVVPAVGGYLGVLPGHTPLLAELSVGELWYRQGQEVTYMAIAFGVVEVLPDRLTILAQVAEKAEDIDLIRVEAARERAEERLAGRTLDVDFERARIALMKALIRQQVVVRLKRRV